MAELRLMQGNEAVAYGALVAECRFFAGYPITPSSEIAHHLARELPKYGGKFIQMEDEIASLAAVLGASVGGLKAMTATSGPGFSLMQEHIGYAAMAEIPCVIVNVQRLGPSTGQPTSPSQGDVMQARWGTHGDHPIIVLSPSSVREAFELTIKAFNFSEKYRTPVILLMDEVVGHMREAIEYEDPEILNAKIKRGEVRGLELTDRLVPTVPHEWYYPYDLEQGDTPPMASFGDGYRYHITGLHHDRSGFPTQRPDEIRAWFERVFRKIESNLGDILLYQEEWLRGARYLVLAYGATARSARHAVKAARARRYKVGFLKLQTIWPFPEDVVEELARKVKRIIVPEMNLGQLALEVERVAGRGKVIRVNRVDGQLITPGEIIEAIEAAAK